MHGSNSNNANTYTTTMNALRYKLWNHVVVSITVQNSVNIVTVWIDGVSLFAETIRLPTGETVFYTTSTSGVSENYWMETGLDDFRIYDRALTQADVDVLYAKDNTMGGCYDRTVCAPALAETDGLFLHLPMDSDMEDASVNHHAVTNTGTDTVSFSSGGVVGNGYGTWDSGDSAYTYAALVPFDEWRAHRGFTISFWVRISKAIRLRKIFYMDPGVKCWTYATSDTTFLKQITFLTPWSTSYQTS